MGAPLPGAALYHRASRQSGHGFSHKIPHGLSPDVGRRRSAGDGGEAARPRTREEQSQRSSEREVEGSGEPKSMNERIGIQEGKRVI